MNDVRAAADVRKLPPPDEIGGPPLTLALGRRRSMREFAARELDAAEIAQLCWAAQGVTEPHMGLRTAPSAGALYPLELDIVTAAGVDRYLPHEHALMRRIAHDVRAALTRAALSQSCIAHAACVLAIAAVPRRTATKYGARGVRYATLEAGHAAQNVLLQACALGLAAVPAGAFDDEAVARVLGYLGGEEPLYLIAAGAPRG